MSDYHEEILLNNNNNESYTSSFNNISMENSVYNRNKMSSSHIFALSDYEIQKIEKLAAISKMIFPELYLMGVLIKSLNDDNRPVINPKNILSILNTKFETNLNDFVVLMINKITYAKMECISANLGEVNYKNKYGVSENILHFSLKSNIEINRIVYIKDKNYNEMIDNFCFTLKNVVNNSFYLVDGVNTKLQSPCDELLANKEYEIKMMIPTNLLDFENTIGKNIENSEKFLIKFKCKSVLHFYVQNDIKYSELISYVKNNLLEYIDNNMENILADKFLNLSSPTIFSFDSDNKYFINYNDSVVFMMDQMSSNYTV
jgi:hypothetical protein